MIDFDLFDQVHFEVADHATALRLTRRLGQTRTAGLLAGEPTYVIVAAFSNGTDFALLMRDVESFVAEESLCAIRYLFDDQIYLLEAGNADWEAHPWLEPAQVDESPRAA
jgi:hypothetical protein